MVTPLATSRAPGLSDLAGQLFARAAEGATRELDRYGAWARGMLAQLRLWATEAGTGATCAVRLQTPLGPALCRQAAVGRCLGCGGATCIDHAFASPRGLACAGCVEGLRVRRTAACPTPAKPSAGMSRAEALRLLRLRDGATAEEIAARYRAIAFKNHPDRAKNEADRVRREARMRRLNEAREVLERRQEAA